MPRGPESQPKIRIQPKTIENRGIPRPEAVFNEDESQYTIQGGERVFVPPAPDEPRQREKFSGAIVEENTLAMDEQGRVASEQWQETEFHPAQYERFIEGQREREDNILLAKYEPQATGKGGKKPEARSLGLALRADVWRETKSDRSPIVGIVIREVYAKRGIRTDMRPGDIIIVDDEGEIAPTTKDGKEVPAIFRTEENKVKISLLVAKQMEGVTSAASRDKMIAQGVIGGKKKNEQAA